MDSKTCTTGAASVVDRLIEARAALVEYDAATLAIHEERRKGHLELATKVYNLEQQALGLREKCASE